MRLYRQGEIGRNLVACIAILAFLILPRALAAQEPLKGEVDPVVALLDGRSVEFLERVSLNEMETAYVDLLADSELAKRSESIKKLIERTRSLETKYGKYRSFERIDAKRIGTDLVLLKYLYKCENFPVLWYLTFYRDFKRGDAGGANNHWVVISIRFDTRLDRLNF